MRPARPVLGMIAAGMVAISTVLLSGGFLANVSSADNSLPDFNQWRAGADRKSKFFRFVRPLLEAENNRVLEQRRMLEDIRAALAESASVPRGRQRRRLAALAEEYRVDPEALSPGALVAQLMLRVDAVPVSLGLAQAAKESAWGTSRFAADGNALFGQRCFEDGCGLVPESRHPQLNHEVRVFETPAEAVASYVRNLNTHPDYENMRRMRAALRRSGRPVTGFQLAATLDSYSERGRVYTEEVRDMIRVNRLGPVVPE